MILADRASSSADLISGRLATVAACLEISVQVPDRNSSSGVCGATMRTSAVVRNILQCPLLYFSPDDGRTSLSNWPCFIWSIIGWYLSVISSADFLLFFLLLLLIGPDTVEEVLQGSGGGGTGWSRSR